MSSPPREPGFRLGLHVANPHPEFDFAEPGDVERLSPAARLVLAALRLGVVSTVLGTAGALVLAAWRAWRLLPG